MFLIFALFSIVPGAYGHSDIGSDDQILRLALARFDRELEQARSGEWNLGSSPAYAELMAIYAGMPNPMSRIDLSQPSMVAPGPGAMGQISGSEFPRHTWALTYDDGPHASRTDPILTVLGNYAVKATFFWLAENVVRQERVLRRAEAEGHSLQNHSYTHEDLVKTTDLQLGYEVSVSTAVMKERFQVHPRYFRCPYGSGGSNSRVRAKIAQEKHVSVMWNVDSLDWADKDVASVVRRVRKQMTKSGGGIVLFHDIQSHTAAVTDKLLKELRQTSLPIRFVTVPEAVAQLNGRAR